MLFCILPVCDMGTVSAAWTSTVAEMGSLWLSSSDVLDDIDVATWFTFPKKREETIAYKTFVKFHNLIQARQILTAKASRKCN